MVIFWIFVFILSLFILSKSADYFTDAAEKIGTILKISPFIVGVLIVAVGTSIPELATSIFGITEGEAGILSGNVVGSTIANILLGLGLVVVISRRVAKFNWDSVSNDMPFIVGAALLLYLTISDGLFTFFEAIIFLLGYVIYILYSYQIHKLNRKQIRDDLQKEIKSKLRQDFKEIKTEHKTAKDILKIAFVFIISLIFVILSAKYTVDSLIKIATIFGLGTSALAVSLVSVGTSLPEISIGIASAKKGNFDMVIGNIMGSNIFNIFVVFGLVGLFTNIVIPSDVITFALPVMIGVIFIQWLVTIDKKITITEGLLMVLLYITFIGKLFNFF